MQYNFEEFVYAIIQFCKEHPVYASIFFFCGYWIGTIMRGV